MKVRIVTRPTGYLSVDGGPLQPWPHKGEVVDLPDALAESMIELGTAERAAAPKPEPEQKVETRPASTEKVETRPARKSAAKGKKAD